MALRLYFHLSEPGIHSALSEKNTHVMDIRAFDTKDTDAVIALWGAAGLVRPWNDPHKDIARKLTVQPELFLVGVEAGEIVATAMGGYDGHRGSVCYLAVAPRLQSKGYGARILASLEDKLTAMGCPKLNLMVRTGNEAVSGFYEHKGYEIQPVVSYGKRLIAD